MNVKETMHVTQMQNASTLKAATAASAKMDSQEMSEHALVCII